MKRPLLPFCVAFLAWVFVAACAAPVEPVAGSDEMGPVLLPEATPDFGDPYFAETSRVTSPLGPTSITRHLIQDRAGSIWLATWEGILRYDGTAFTNLTNEQGLRRFHVFSAFEDRAGLLWFGTIGAGVYRYDGETFAHFTTREGLIHNSIGCFAEDRNGHLWIGTQGGISRFDGRTFQNFTRADGMTDNDVNSIVEDAAGNLWIGTRGTACVFDGTGFHTVQRANGESFTNVRTVLLDRSGDLWFGGNDGLWKRHAGTWSCLTSAFTGYLYQDRQGTVWASTASSLANDHDWVLARYRTSLDSAKVEELAPFSPGVGMLFGLLEDAQGNLWFGFLNGAGRFDGNSFHAFRE